MKRFSCLLLLCIAGCTIRTGSQPLPAPQPRPHVQPAQPYCPDGNCPYQAVAPVDLPLELRERNYKGGSCVHASTVMILRWQGCEELAAWWRETYAHGESETGLIRKAEKAGLHYAYTSDGDEAFLDWCSSTRRGAVIFYKPSHSICFFGWTADGRQAVLLDNNRIKEHELVDRETFIHRWRGFGGFAFTPVYSPAPPRPYL